MDWPEVENDEPLTPPGRLFLRPETEQVINCVLGIKHLMHASAVKSRIAASILTQRPRFTSLLVRDHRGIEHWRKTHIDIDRHVIVVDSPVGDGDDEDAVNDYLADLAVSSPLSTDKPLWEIHLLMAHYCAVFRIHHPLGDGISLMSMLLSCCRRADDPDALPSIVSSPGGTNSRGRSDGTTVWEFVKVVWFTVVFIVELIGKSLWVSDKNTAVSGGAGVELWRRWLRRGFGLTT